MYRDLTEGKITTPIRTEHQAPTRASNCTLYAEISDETFTQQKRRHGRGRDTYNTISQEHSNLLNTDYCQTLKHNI